jgi:NADPH-dependent 7-cyano-7-deazaguanine reductase QueF
MGGARSPQSGWRSWSIVAQNEDPDLYSADVDYENHGWMIEHTTLPAYVFSMYIHKHHHISNVNESIRNSRLRRKSKHLCCVNNDYEQFVLNK